MRQSRWERLDYAPMPERKSTKRDVALLLARHVKRSLIAKKLIPASKPLLLWDWYFGDTGGTVCAHARGEARSQIKKQMGIKKRLPLGVQIRKVP